MAARPQYVMFPHDEAGFGIDDQFYLGDSGLLVKPVSVEGATEAEIYLSDDQVSDLHMPCRLQVAHG
jgi:mannosyl-oligosaccharide alpha-1,3-glucosidase